MKSNFILGCILIKLIAFAGLVWSSICLARQLELREDGKKLEMIKMKLHQGGGDLLDYAFGGSGESSDCDMKLAYTASNVAFYGLILLIGCVGCIAMFKKMKS